MVISRVYTKEFFEDLQTGARLSAMAIVPAVLESVKPRSVVDVGCGTGEFLQVFREHQVPQILGIDGAYVDKSQLVIPQENFRALDLTKPFRFNETYDLALCLEVAEHLAPESARDFIESLTTLAPVILFSAAIPRQGGVHHINEQWLDYWTQLFMERKFVPVDALRKRIWNNRHIAVWYRQNALFFCTEQALASNKALEQEFRATNRDMLAIVHPELYLLGYKTPHPSALNGLRRRASKIKILRKMYYYFQK